MREQQLWRSIMGFRFDFSSMNPARQLPIPLAVTSTIIAHPTDGMMMACISSE
jgi:hypothetical protein